MTIIMKIIMYALRLVTDIKRCQFRVDSNSKYKNLEILIVRMWHSSTTIIPVVKGALGTIKKKRDHKGVSIARK